MNRSDLRPVRTALVTGASSGLGKEFARQLAAAAVDIVLVARRRERLEAIAAELQQLYPVAVTVITADLRDPAAPRHIYDGIRGRGIEVTHLINNAGVAGSDLLRQPDWQEHERFFQLMMLSVAHLCHLFIPPMRDQGFGRVVNVASMAGRIPRKGGCNYGPSKAYLVALSEDLNLTLAGTGVNVCALCPGFTHTDFHAAAGLEAAKARVPGILWYRPEVVVREALRAVERRRSVYPSGRLYRLFDPLLQWAPARRLIRLRADH